MEAYSDFARVYDIFMDNVEYEKWAEYLIGSLKEYGIEDGIVLELGCGTGVMTELLAESGYDMIGVDNSEEMLGEAMEKRAESGHEILYLEQDMREFELYGTVRAVVSVCDCMNYITEEDDLLTVFKLVNNYLDPDGIFIFDMNTPYKYREMLGNTTIAENREEGSFIWENEFDEEIAVLITDTQGRAFRNGAVGVAIGCSGINPLWKRAGEKDLYGRELQTSEVATGDELAAAASLVMGQADEGLPVVIIRGFDNFDKLRDTDTGINPLLRPKEFDVFRN